MLGVYLCIASRTMLPWVPHELNVMPSEAVRPGHSVKLVGLTGDGSSAIPQAIASGPL